MQVQLNERNWSRVRNAINVLRDLTEEELDVLCGLFEEKKFSENKKQKENTVTELINELGIPPSIIGYNYIREAMVYYMNRERVRWMEVYTFIAQSFETSTSKVERAIRYALEEHAFKKENKEILLKVFGTTRHIYASRAIAMMAEYVKKNS